MFILRVQSRDGLKRLTFPSCESTWGDFQTAVAEAYGVSAARQRVSTSPLHRPRFVTATRSQSLAVLGLQHGDILYLDVPASSTAHTAPARHQLTKDCSHGPRGRCLHCADTSAPPSAKCNHGTAATCPNCSEHVASQSEELAPWLCDHPDTAFCPKCLPPGEAPTARCSCSGLQRCPVCLPQQERATFVPYAQLMREKRALCRYKHAAETTCHLCAPPQELSYRGDPNCTAGHRPWPQGSCGRCRPPNATLKLQAYRHVDGISFEDVRAGERFTALWQQNPGLQWAALLFGHVNPEPTAPDSGAVRAHVCALYVPSQEPGPTGVFFRKDTCPIVRVAAALGLQPVGWAITTLPRAANDPVFLSGREIRQAARFQAKYANALGHAQFVTMVIEYNDAGQIEPNAYMISDQGVALERDGVLDDAAAMEKLTVRKEGKGEYVPSVIYKSKALSGGDAFVPDELLVKVVAMQPHRPRSLFLYHQFPLTGGTTQTLRAHLEAHRGEPYHQSCSDFGLLAFLPTVIGIKLTEALCAAVEQQRSLDSATTSRLDAAFATLQ